MKTIILTFILLLLALPCPAQKKPAASLLDTIGQAACDDLNVRLYTVRRALGDNPDSVVDIFIYSKKGNGQEGFYLEGRIQSMLNTLRVDKNRVAIAQASTDGDVRTELWLVPNGAEKPSIEVTNQDYSLKLEKPSIYYQDGYLVDNECWVNIGQIYSNILLQNTGVRGNLVIYATSAKKFQKEKSRLTTLLVNKYKVPPNRIKFYYVKTDQLYTTGVEYWLVPKRKAKSVK
jgi:hypothetical protein